MDTAKDQAILENKLQIYRQAWLGSDLERFKSLWDPGYPRLTFMPMERAQILHGWDAVIRYWQTILPITRMERWDVDSMFVDFLSPDLAWVFCEHSFAYRVTDGTQLGLQAYEARTTHVFHKVPGGDWLTIHYEDSIQWFASSDEARRAS